MNLSQEVVKKHVFSSDPDDTNRYQFITDGCGDPADNTLEIINQGESTSASFSIESFVFKAGDSNEIFFHCQVDILLKEQTEFQI